MTIRTFYLAAALLGTLVSWLFLGAFFATNGPDIPLFLRAMHRRSAPPGSPTPSIGFRCVSDEPGQTVPTAPLSAPSGGDTNTVPSGAPTMPAASGQDSAPATPTATLAPG